MQLINAEMGIEKNWSRDIGILDVMFQSLYLKENINMMVYSNIQT